MFTVPRANSLSSNAASGMEQLVSKAYPYRLVNVSLMDYRMLMCSISECLVDLQKTNWHIARSAPPIIDAYVWVPRP
jgi:hypothetical protein